MPWLRTVAVNRRWPFNAHDVSLAGSNKTFLLQRNSIELWMLAVVLPYHKHYRNSRKVKGTARDGVKKA